jgi:hypothetical protein
VQQFFGIAIPDLERFRQEFPFDHAIRVALHLVGRSIRSAQLRQSQTAGTGDLMKNREPKEWRILQRWSKLQKKAQNETDRGKLAKILGKMGGLIVQMEKGNILGGNDAGRVLILEPPRQRTAG